MVNSAGVLFRLTASTVGAVVVAVMVGVSYQLIEMRLDARRFPQVGESVDIGGYKLNINCTGQGSPEIILESGLEDSAANWGLVQPEIAKFTRVCSYDRAGYGWSDPGPMPRTSTQIAMELHKLLQNAGEKPPYVLVGHSFGATIVRIYNGLYPSDVVGTVLVDGGPDDLRLPASIQKLSDADLRRRQRDREWVRIRYLSGVSRFLARKAIQNNSSPLVAREWSYFDTEPKFVDATTSEVENLALLDPRGADEIKKSGTFGNKPLIVLIAGKGMWGLPLTSQDWIDLRNRWVDGQMRLAQQLSTRGKWIIVSNSTHMIPDERPEAIASAVREIRTEVDQN